MKTIGFYKRKICRFLASSTILMIWGFRYESQFGSLSCIVLSPSEFHSISHVWLEICFIFVVLIINSWREEKSKLFRSRLEAYRGRKVYSANLYSFNWFSIPEIKFTFFNAAFLLLTSLMLYELGQMSNCVSIYQQFNTSESVVVRF